MALATDGYAAVFRRLSSPGLSDAHMHKHTFCTHGGTQLAHRHTPLFSVFHPVLTNTQPPSLLLFRCARGFACAAIISNHVSVFSLGLCELPPPGQPICVVVAVMVMASKLSLLPAASSPMMSSVTDRSQIMTQCR